MPTTALMKAGESGMTDTLYNICDCKTDETSSPVIGGVNYVLEVKGDAVGWGQERGFYTEY
jgi:hypothetical protein